MKKIILILSMILINLSGCDKQGEILNIAGSTTVLPVVSLASEHFKSDSKMRIIVNAGGSGVGINQLGLGKLDIGMASRDMTGTEIKKYPNVQFVTHSIGKDTVIPVVSSEIYNAGITALSLADK